MQKYQSIRQMSASQPSSPSISVSHLNVNPTLSSLMDDSMTKEQRPVGGVAGAFIAFEMILYALHKKGTEQFSCFRPIRLIPQPRLTGSNEKRFEDFLTKNAA